MFRLPTFPKKVSHHIFQPAANPVTIAVRNATKKAGGTVVNKADSPGQRLGVKRFGGERVWNQFILVRQHGFKWHPGLNVYKGKDYTLHAKIDGYVHFFKIDIPGKRVNSQRTYINVLPTREGKECQEALVTFAAQIKKKHMDSVEYRKGQEKFIADMRKVYGPGVHRDDYIVDKGKSRILSRLNEV